MEEFILPLITASIVSFASIKLVKPLAVEHGLVDNPDARKLHEGSIPLVGGIGIFVGVLTALVVHLPAAHIPAQYLMSAALLVIIGVIDDRHDLSVRFRIIGQVIAASIMVFGAGVYLEDLGGIFGIGNIHLGIWGYPFTIIAVLAAINAFNFIDGIDGLAGSLSIVAFSSIGGMMLMNSSGLTNTVFIALIMVAAIVPYLFFNMGLMGSKLKKVFMGDAGSMFMGLSVVWLLAAGSQGEQRAFSPVTALWIIAIPLMDMTAIIFRRLKKGDSPFKPDRDHLHHIFMRAGYSDRKSLAIITCLSVVLAVVGVLGEVLNIEDYFMAMAFVIVFSVYYTALQHAWLLSKQLKAFLKK